MPDSFQWSVLLKKKDPWVHIVVIPEAEMDELVKTAPHDVGAVVRIVRGRNCATAMDLFREWGAALQFPSYFGENWDAFEDCLLDLEWLPAKGYVIILTNANHLLKNAPHELHVFCDILNRAAEEWNGVVEGPGDSERSPVPFHVVLHTLPECEAETRARLLKAGLKIRRA